MHFEAAREATALASELDDLAQKQGAKRNRNFGCLPLSF
jgi:hypothetical protein